MKTLENRDPDFTHKLTSLLTLSFNSLITRPNRQLSSARGIWCPRHADYHRGLRAIITKSIRSEKKSVH